MFLGSGGETDFTQIMQLHYCAVTLPKYVISISGKFCEGDVYLKNTNPWVMAWGGSYPAPRSVKQRLFSTWPGCLGEHWFDRWEFSGTQRNWEFRGSQGPFWCQASQSHIREVSGTESSLPVLKSVTQLICCVYPLQKHLSPAGTAALMRKQKAIHTFILSFIHTSILNE